MKLIFKGIILVVWMISTVVLTISIIGIMTLDMACGTKDWFDFPLNVLEL